MKSYNDLKDFIEARRGSRIYQQVEVVSSVLHSPLVVEVLPLQEATINDLRRFFASAMRGKDHWTFHKVFPEDVIRPHAIIIRL